MKRSIIYFGGFFIMFLNIAFAQITKISEMNLLEEILSEADSNTLVIFDVDHVLIMPTDEYSLNRNPFRKQLWVEMSKKLPKEKFTFFKSIAISSAKWQLVDPCIINIIAALNEKHIPTIALTSLSTGKVGVIDKMEDLRIKELNSVGLSFKHSTPLKEELYADALEEEHGIPLLKDGIILTAEVDKAVVLEYILRMGKYFPKSIIFIDDQLKNLESLDRLCDKLKIKFHGVHYTAVSLMPPPVIDEALELARFKILEEEHVWISYNDLINRCREMK
jgi:hypothetical protein